MVLPLLEAQLWGSSIAREPYELFLQLLGFLFLFFFNISIFLAYIESVTRYEIQQDPPKKGRGSRRAVE